ncbi:cutinase family protein [Actinomycetospora sp. OC33-EN08]|uniref:Cutinase family protein n=1 Tax=Actinomycetospora aurantiaca TaxID=3129233 RepID=A0ABU8MUB0_9PSEU
MGAADVRLEVVRAPGGATVLADGRPLPVPPDSDPREVALAAGRRHAARLGRTLRVELVDGGTSAVVEIEPFPTAGAGGPVSPGRARQHRLPAGEPIPSEAVPAPARSRTVSAWRRPEPVAPGPDRRPVGSLVAAALVAVAVLVGAVGTGVATLASSQALPDSCRPVTLYAVGGAGGNSDVLTAVTDPLVQQFGEKVSVVTVPPPATGGSYASAESAAVGALSDAVGDHVEGCPTGAIMLFGYSAGAQVAGDLASRIGTGLEPRIPANLVQAVGLFGDPARSPATRVVPDGTTGQGVLPPRAVEFGALDARTIQICAPGDPVCDNPAGGAAPALDEALASPVHGSYTQLAVAQGTTAPRWAADSLAKVVAAVPTDAGPAPATTTTGAAPTSGSGGTGAAPTTSAGGEAGAVPTTGAGGAVGSTAADPGSEYEDEPGGGGADVTQTPGSGGSGATVTRAPGSGGVTSTRASEPTGTGSGDVEVTPIPGSGGVTSTRAPGGGSGSVTTTRPPGAGSGDATVTRAPGTGAGPSSTRAPSDESDSVTTTRAPGSGSGSVTTTQAPGSDSGSGSGSVDEDAGATTTRRSGEPSPSAGDEADPPSGSGRGDEGTETDATFSLTGGLDGFKSTPWNNQNATDPSGAESPNVPGREAVKFEMPGGGKRTEAEPDVPEFQEGETKFVGYSGFFDQGFPTDTGTWQLIMQFKQPGTGSPPLAVEVGNGQLRLANNGGSQRDFCPVGPGAFSFQLGITFGGGIDAYCNGRQTLSDYRTPESNVKGSAYLKTGIYRDESIGQDSTLFLNDLKIGDDLASVSGLAGATTEPDAETTDNESADAAGTSSRGATAPAAATRRSG